MNKQIMMGINKRKTTNLILCVMLYLSVFFIPFVYSHHFDTIINYNFPQGYTIIGNSQDFIIKNSDYEYNFFVRNTTTGSLVDGLEVDCFIYIADETGNFRFYDEVDYLGDYWGIIIPKENLTDSKYFSYGIACESLDYGGSITSSWEIKNYETGLLKLDLENNFSIFILIVLLVFACIMIYFRQLSIGGFIFIVTGFIMLFSELNVVASIIAVFIGIIILFLDNYYT